LDDGGEFLLDCEPDGSYFRVNLGSSSLRDNLGDVCGKFSHEFSSASFSLRESLTKELSIKIDVDTGVVSHVRDFIHISHELYNLMDSEKRRVFFTDATLRVGF